MRKSLFLGYIQRHIDKSARIGSWRADIILMRQRIGFKRAPCASGSLSRCYRALLSGIVSDRQRGIRTSGGRLDCSAVRFPGPGEGRLGAKKAVVCRRLGGF